MKNLVLCEGKTDAIVLSYYLFKKFGWEYNNRETKNPDRVSFKENSYETEFVYSRNGEDTYILSVGGYNNFFSKIKRISNYLQNTNMQEAFDKLVILADKDDKDSDSVIKEFERYSCLNKIQVGNWTSKVFFDGYGESFNVDICLVLVPDSEEGAIETFLLNSIKELGEEERIIVEESDKFIDNFDLNNYLIKSRDRLKSKLSTTISIIDPEKTFSHIDDMIKSFNWIETDTVDQCFSPFGEL